MKAVGHVGNDDLFRQQMEADRQVLLPVLAGLQAWARNVTDQPETFWQQQRAVIRRRMAAAEKASLWQPLRLAGAGVLGLMILATLLLSSTPTLPSKSVVKATADPDQDLLMTVEAAVRSGAPRALAPVSPDLQEISLAAPNSSVSKTRNTEISNEN